MKASQVKDEAGLGQWMSEMEGRLDGAERLNGSLRAALNSVAKGGAVQDADLQGFGAFLKALIRRDHAELIRMGGRPTSWGAEVEGKTLATDTSPGSYLIPTQFYAGIWRIANEASVALPRLTKLQMTTRQLKVPVETVTPSLYWPTSDGSTVTQTSATFTEETISAKSCVSYIKLTESLLEDQDTQLMSVFAKQFGEALAAEIDRQFFTSNSDPFVGLEYDTDVNEYALGAGLTSLEDVSTADVHELIDKLTTLRYRRGAELFCSVGLLSNLRNLRDANGRFILAEATQADPARIFGIPVIPCDQISSSPTSGRAVMFYGALRNAIYGDRKSLVVELFDKTSDAVTSEVIYIRARSRWAINIPVPGAFARMVLADA